MLTDSGKRRLKRAKQQRQTALPQKLTEADFTAKALADYQLTKQQLFYFDQPVSVQQLIFERQTNPSILPINSRPSLPADSNYLYRGSYLGCDW
ncbi:hypothetical protein QY884_04200 [Latilactobacillus sakei]